MTTINTSDDLLRLLRENADFRDAVRRELLGQELLEMPAKFDAFVAMQTETNKQMSEAIQQLVEHTKVTDRRLDVIERRLDGIDGRLDGIDGRLDGMDARFDGIDARFDGMDARLDKMSNDMVEMHGIMKTQHDGFQRFRGNYSESTTIKRATQLTQFVGEVIGRELRWERNLSIDHRKQMLDSFPRVASISHSDYYKFLAADLVIEATYWYDKSDVHYISIQSSYTCHEDDLDRALSNAAILRNITGRTTYSVVSGVYLNERVVDAVNGGGEDSVLWFRLEEEALDI